MEKVVTKTMYKSLLRPILFLFDPEKIHHFTFSFLKIFASIPFTKKLLRAFYLLEDPSLERELFGIKFRNPVGLAAGFDKDAKLIDELSCLGFGFIDYKLSPLPFKLLPSKHADFIGSHPGVEGYQDE